MRFGTSLPIALFALSIPTLTSTSQTSWKAPSTLSRTLVDALNDDPDYTSLLYLLQRTLLIPTLNKLNGSTLFAPTNDAIAKHASKHPLWQFALEESNDLIPDNRHEQLRQQLFYHLLNISIPAIPSEPSVSEYETLLYPRKPISPPSKDPPPYPPWMPIPGGTLGGDPQRIRLATRDNSVSIGADFYGKHGVSIVKGLKDAGNGMLLGIGEVLEPPPDLATVVSQHTSLSYFQKIMDSEIVKTLKSTSGMTLFLPTDDAWSVLHPMERLYLESEFSANDMRRILSAHAVVASKGVHWSTSFNGSTKLTTLADTNLDIKKSPENITVGTATLLEPDIYASNGVLHTVSSLLFPEDFLQLTPEKYLLALNCTKFISLLHSVNLTGLINNTDTKYTILAPSDDVLKIFDGPEIPPSGSEELKKLLQYHFIPGHWTPSKLQSGRLLETALKEPGLNGGRQVVPVEVQKDDKKKGEDKTISFGSAGVIGEPIEANNTLIYFVSRPLVPPADALQVALPTLELSTFLAAIFSTDKAERLRTTPSTSLLIPHNKAFERLGLLVSAHLLAPSSKDDLANVILHHALTSVEYASSLESGSQHTFSTLEGSDVKIDRFANGTAHISSSGGWSGLKAELTTLDLLTQTGVIHELSDIMIPRSVQLTIGKLVKAAKGGTMSTLVNKAGFEWVLNGTAPPEGSPWADEKYGNAGWTLLCPPDEAFKNVNLTQLYSDVEGLKDIVSQHLIPMSPMNAKSDGDPDPLYNNRPLVLDDSTYSTIRSTSSAYGDIVFQKQAEGEGYIVGIKGARGTSGEEDSARVLAWGRSSTGTGTGGVVQIDRLLVPYRPSWFFMYGAPTIVGGVGMLAICGFFYLVRLVWLRDTTEATYEPVGGFGRDDDDDA